MCQLNPLPLQKVMIKTRRFNSLLIIRLVSLLFPQKYAHLVPHPKSCVQRQTPTGFTFKGTRKSYPIVHLFQMFVIYVKHLSHKETQREMIAATMLDVLKARASTTVFICL